MAVSPSIQAMPPTVAGSHPSRDRLAPLLEVGQGHVHPHARLPGAVEASVVGGGADPDQFDERVEGELLGGARVVDDRVGAGLVVRVDEPGSAAAG